MNSLFHHEEIVGLDVRMNDIRRMHMIDKCQDLCGEYHDDEFIHIAECFLLVFVTDVNQRSIRTMFRSKYTRIVTDQCIFDVQETTKLRKVNEPID